MILSVGVLLAAVLCLAPAGHPSAETRRWVPVPEKSSVAFEATHPLGNFSGRTADIAGEFTGDPGNLEAGVRGSLRVQAASLRTGDAGRDRDVRAVLEVERHPAIRYTVDGVESSFPLATDRADVLLTIRGRLEIRGVERPLVFSGRVRLRDDHLWVRGESAVRMTDFGITPPKRFFLSVGNEVLVTFDLTLAPAP
jgi:polyisoprenoid-binding protein YceI